MNRISQWVLVTVGGEAGWVMRDRIKSKKIMVQERREKCGLGKDKKVNKGM